MKRFLVAMIVLLFAISCPLVTFAAEEKKLTDEELYACYQEIIEKVNENYGYEFCLEEFEDIPYFWSVDEFKRIVEEYCRIKKEKSVVITPVLEGQLTGRADKVVTAANTVTVELTLDTVHITFYGTFYLLQDYQNGNIQNGSYYVDSESYVINSVSDQGVITYQPYGATTVEVYDHGRSHYAVQTFNVLVRSLFRDYDTVTAGFYISPATGNVTPLSS